MGLNTATAAFSSWILFNDQVSFDDGFMERITVGAPESGGSTAPGILKSYRNSDTSGILVLDRLKISVDPGDVSKNYLVFNIFRGDQTVVFSFPIPIQEIIVGNPNFTNFTTMIKANQQLQVVFTPTSNEATILEYFQWRIRVMDLTDARI
jgi:hypothetical protein